jgi:hypothetical protein
MQIDEEVLEIWCPVLMEGPVDADFARRNALSLVLLGQECDSLILRLTELQVAAEVT